jgi:hypothetical protein
MDRATLGAKRRKIVNLAHPACWGWPIELTDFRSAGDARDYLDAYRVLAAWQQSRCAICGEVAYGDCLDHDHDTGLIRGILCSSCNAREGKWARGASGVFGLYRHINPANMLSMEIRYPSNGVVGRR